MVPASAPPRLTIATRESALALWQAEHVRARLAALYPACEVRLLGLTTQGDRVLDQPLADIGGKGLFIKELEVAMADGRADLAVHSLKDVPMDLADGFALAAISAREDPRDAFVSNRHRTLAELPPGAVVGTSSLRRESQLRARFPHLAVEPLRGNVQTRLRKLDEGQYAAIILAAAGLKRLGLADRIASLLTPEDSLPAVGQGALGIECLAARADLPALLAPLNDAATSDCVRAERAMSRALGGSCQVPIGGYAERSDGALRLRGFVARPDGRELVADEVRGPAAQCEALGAALAEKLKSRGATQILAELSLPPQ
jgi:hydroxymethylbilane synthase